MNYQLIADISDIFIFDPLRIFISHPMTLPAAVLLLVYMFWPSRPRQLGDPIWDKFFKARGFDAKHEVIRGIEYDIVRHQWCAAVDGIDWLIDDRGRYAMLGRSLTIWLSRDIPIDPELKAQEFLAIDLLAWATGQCRRVSLSPQQARSSRPSYSHAAARLAPILGKAAPLEWQNGPVQILLENGRLRAGFEIGRYAIDDAMFAMAARDFSRVLTPFGITQETTGFSPTELTSVPDGGSGDLPRLEKSAGIGATLAAFAAALVVPMLASPFYKDSVPVTLVLSIGSYFLVIRLLR